MELLASSPNRLLSQVIIVLALATQVLPAPYTVIANVQRHVVSSGGNTIHFPAQVTIQCPDYFGLRCHHQVNGHQVVINVFHGNPDGEGNGVIKSVIITRDGRVETSQDSQPQSPTNTNKYATEGIASMEDSAMNDVFSGESFNGKGEEEFDDRKFEVTTEKDNEDEDDGGLLGSKEKNFWDDSEESQTETRNDEETEAKKPSTEEKRDSLKKNGEEDDPGVKDYDYDNYPEKDNSRDTSKNNDGGKTTEPNVTSIENPSRNEASKKDSGTFDYDEVTTHASNGVEVTSSKALLTGYWRNFF